MSLAEDSLCTSAQHGKEPGIDSARSRMWHHGTDHSRGGITRFVFVEKLLLLYFRGLDGSRRLGEMGYDAEWCVLGSDDIGGPHKRERIWILAYSTKSDAKRCHDLKDRISRQNEL